MEELNSIQCELNAPKGQYNSFGKYKYRSCEDILAAAKSLLKKYKCTLTLSDDVVPVGSRIYIKATATLTNEKGKFVTTTAFAREEETKKGMDGSQVTGASSSYARKYALNGLFAIDDTADADKLNTSPEYTQQQENPQKAGNVTGAQLKKRFPGNTVRLSSITNVPIVVLDYEKDMKTENGDDRYLVSVKEGETFKKFFTASKEMKQILDKISDIEDGFPFETIIRSEPFGDNKIKYIFT